MTTWEPTTDYPVKYLRIGTKDRGAEDPLVSMETGLIQDRADFWFKLRAHGPAKVGEIKDEL